MPPFAGLPRGRSASRPLAAHRYRVGVRAPIIERSTTHCTRRPPRLPVTARTPVPLMFRPTAHAVYGFPHARRLASVDGGAARQLLMHPSIERIVVAELDAAVVEMARRHLSDVHRGALDDSRVELVIGDAAQFVARTREQFDVVVFDLTPPDSPA